MVCACGMPGRPLTGEQCGDVLGPRVHKGETLRELAEGRERLGHLTQSILGHSHSPMGVGGLRGGGLRRLPCRVRTVIWPSSHRPSQGVVRSFPFLIHAFLSLLVLSFYPSPVLVWIQSLFHQAWARASYIAFLRCLTVGLNLVQCPTLRYVSTR